jgi:hypothetical protein
LFPFFCFRAYIVVGKYNNNYYSKNITFSETNISEELPNKENYDAEDENDLQIIRKCVSQNSVL